MSSKLISDFQNYFNIIHSYSGGSRIFLTQRGEPKGKHPLFSQIFSGKLHEIERNLDPPQLIVRVI